MKKLSIIIAFVLALASCQSKVEVKDYTDADAVYLNLEKIYTLHEDGSMEFEYRKEQMLLTYRAFHSLYGQTDIYYNPLTDSVVVDLAETETPDGKIVPVPENGYVDMIPGYASGAAPYSHLRHKAVVHTALERKAIIRSKYRVFTKSGTWPNLAAHEMVTNECPVEQYKLTVKVPKNTPFSYQAYNFNQEPAISSKGGYDIYTWKITDIAQIPAEPLGMRFNRDKIQISFNSGEDFFTSFNELTSQRAFTFETNIEMRNRVNKITEGLNDPYRKIGAIQQLVTEEIQTLPVPFKQAGYQIRPAIQTWESMSGTAEEKAVLLTALIRSQGLEAVPVAFVPDYLFEKDSVLTPVGPLDLLSFSHVEITQIREKIYLSSTHTSLTDPVYQFPDHLIVPLEMGYSQVNLTPVSPTEFQLAWDGTLRFDPTGTMIFGSFECNYIGRNNPFQGLSLFPEKLKGLYPGYGIIEVSSPRSTLISYERTFDNYLTVFADKVMFDLPLNHSGFDSWGLTHLAAERTGIMELPSTIREFQRLELTLPDNMHPVDFDRDITINNDLGRVSLRYATHGSTVTIMRNLNVSQQIIHPEEYAQLKSLLDPWMNPEYKKIILEKN